LRKRIGFLVPKGIHEHLYFFVTLTHFFLVNIIKLHGLPQRKEMFGAVGVIGI